MKAIVGQGERISLLVLSWALLLPAMKNISMQRTEVDNPEAIVLKADLAKCWLVDWTDHNGSTHLHPVCLPRWLESSLEPLYMVDMTRNGME